jgi:hypothetical protein
MKSRDFEAQLTIVERTGDLQGAHLLHSQLQRWRAFYPPAVGRQLEQRLLRLLPAAPPGLGALTSADFELDADPALEGGVPCKLESIPLLPMPSSDTTGTVYENMQDQSVSISPSTDKATVSIRRCQASDFLLSSPVESLMSNECQKCVLRLEGSLKQLRMTDCRDCQVYVETALSLNVALEECQGLTFHSAPGVLSICDFSGRPDSYRLILSQQ